MLLSLFLVAVVACSTASARTVLLTNEISKAEHIGLPLHDLHPQAQVEVPVAVRIFSSAPPKNGCECIKYDCGCCLHLDLPTIHVNDTGCTNVTYLPDEYGISLTFDIDGYVVINETISARNPPPICAGVPHLEKYASVCIVFHDLDLTKVHFRGCMRLQVRLVHVMKEEVELGCFNVPLKQQQIDWIALQPAKRLV